MHCFITAHKWLGDTGKNIIEKLGRTDERTGKLNLAVRNHISPWHLP